MVSSVAATVWACRLVPSLGLLRTRLGFRRNLARLFRLGSGDLTVRLSGMVVSQLDKFLLGYFVGLRWVAFYELAWGLVNQLRALPLTVIAPFTPMASDLGARGAWGRIETLYARGLRYLNACGLPLFAFAAVFAFPIVRFWLGEGYGAVALAIQIMVVGNYLNLLTGPAYFISLGLGQPRIGVRFSLVLTCLTIVLSPPLIILFGYPGAVWSYSGAAFMAALYLIWCFHRENRPAVGNLYFETVGLPALLIGALTFGVRWLFDFSPDLGRWGTGVLLGEAATIFFLLSTLVMWQIRLIGREEWRLVWNAIGVPRLTTLTRR